MIHFLKKVFEGKIDESAHSQFVRFSKGEFHNRAVMKIRKSERIKMGASFELASDFAMLSAELGGGKVSGIILSKKDISGILSKNSVNGVMEEKKGGLFYKTELQEQNIHGNALKDIVENADCSLLDVEGNGFSLKTKKTLPKPNPKGAEGKVNDKFCVMELDGKFWNRVREEFLFDLPEGKKYELGHLYQITGIILPVDEKDPEQIRLKAKRKGKIIRKALVDGKEIMKEKEFAA